MLNFDDMILSHSKWKNRLKKAILAKEQIDTQVAGKDDQCELGKWIHGEGKKYAAVSAFGDLKAKHARFHASILNVVNQARSASPEKALEMVDPTTGEFGRASSDCINAILALKQSLAKV